MRPDAPSEPVVDASGPPARPTGASKHRRPPTPPADDEDHLARQLRATCLASTDPAPRPRIGVSRPRSGPQPARDQTSALDAVPVPPLPAPVPAAPSLSSSALTRPYERRRRGAIWTDVSRADGGRRRSEEGRCKTLPSSFPGDTKRRRRWVYTPSPRPCFALLWVVRYVDQPRRHTPRATTQAFYTGLDAPALDSFRVWSVDQTWGSRASGGGGLLRLLLQALRRLVLAHLPVARSLPGKRNQPCATLRPDQKGAWRIIKRRQPTARVRSEHAGTTRACLSRTRPTSTTRACAPFVRRELAVRTRRGYMRF